MKKRNNHNEVNIFSKNYIADDRQYENVEWTVASIIELCDEFKLGHQIIGDCLFVSTAIGHWYFNLNQKGPMKLFHENLLQRSTSNKFCNTYHVQKKKFRNPVSIINYIYAHDCKGYSYMRYSKREKAEYAARKSMIYA